MATIQGVYVALFGRPADPTGLAFFNTATSNGANLNAIGDLASTQEYKDRFAGQSNTQIVNSIYQSLFGRDAEATGLNFFVDALNKGTLNIKNIAIAILDGAQGTDKTISANKVAAADLYTKAIDTPTEIGSYSGNAAAAQGRAFVAGVTTTVPSAAAVDTAVLAMQNAGAVGNTINIAPATASVAVSLTAGTTENGVLKTATNNNDTINATTVANAAANVAGADAFVFGANGTKVDAGLGIDTINLGIDTAALAVATDQLKNVEIINVTASLGTSGLDVTNAAQAQQVWDVAASTAVANTISGILNTATAGLKGNFGATAQSLGFASVDAGSSVKLALDTAVASNVTVSNVGTLNVSNTGTSNVTLVTETKAVVLSGDGALTLTATDSILESVTASSYAGNLTVDASANAALKTYTGGTAIDTVTLDTTHTNDITITTGAGADTVTVLADRSATGAGPFTLVNNAANKAVVLTGGDGADTFVFGNAAANLGTGAAVANDHNGAVGNVASITSAAELAKSLITISDFAKASDSIKVGDGATGVATQQALTTGDLATISAQADLLAAATKAASFFAAVDKVAIFNYGTDAYILVNSGTTAFEAGDTLIKVTGAVNTDFTASNFQIV